MLKYVALGHSPSMASTWPSRTQEPACPWWQSKSSSTSAQLWWKDLPPSLKLLLEGKGPHWWSHQGRVYQMLKRLAQLGLQVFGCTAMEKGSGWWPLDDAPARLATSLLMMNEPAKVRDPFSPPLRQPLLCWFSVFVVFGIYQKFTELGD